MANANHDLANDAQPRLTTGQRWLAWGSIVGGGLLVAAAVALVMLMGIRYELRLIAALLFGVVLVADGVLLLRRKFAIRNSRAWQTTSICANLVFMGATLINAWWSSTDLRFGRAGIAIVAAFLLTMGMFFLVMLLSGASWRGEMRPRR
jgi:hypothetical protein